MNRLTPSRLPAIFATALLGLGLSAHLHATDWQALMGNSPFGQSAVTAPATASGELEFRGVVQEGSIYLVNLYNPATKTSQWIPVKGRVPGLEVQSYDAGSDKVSITTSGRPLTLALKQAHVALLAAAPVAPPAAVASADAAGPNDSPEDRSREERRAEIREMMRARRESGGVPPGELSATCRPRRSSGCRNFAAAARALTGQPANGGPSAVPASEPGPVATPAPTP